MATKARKPPAKIDPLSPRGADASPRTRGKGMPLPANPSPGRTGRTIPAPTQSATFSCAKMKRSGPFPRGTAASTLDPRVS